MKTATSRTITFSPIGDGNMKKEVKTTLEVATDELMTEIESNPNKGIFRILNQKDGDKRLVWDRMSMADIKAARELFNTLSSQGLRAYRVGSGGKASTEFMESFDPTEEEVIFMPMTMIAGG